MSLRRRLALLSALAVAVTVLLASALVYVLVRDRLRSDIDNDLHHQADVVTQRASQAAPVINGSAPGPVTFGTGGPPPVPPKANGKPAKGEERGVFLQQAVPPPGPGGAPALAQVIGPNGAVVADPTSQYRLPVSSADRDLATNGGNAQFSDVSVQGTDLRVLTQPMAAGGAIQVARSLEDTNHTLNTLIIILAAVSAGGIALAAGLGPVVARTALAPAGEVSDARRGGRPHPRPDPPDRGAGRRRAGPPGRQLQRDARRARTLRVGPAPAWSPTPHTSCAPRSPRCGPTSRRSAAPRTSTRRSASAWSRI